MADNDLTPHGLDAEDPDQVHAPLSQAVAEFLPADDLTRARHLRTALADFQSADQGPTVHINPPKFKNRLSRTLSAVAAAALLIFGFGVLLPLLSSPSGEDANFQVRDSAAATPLASEADDADDASEEASRSSAQMMVIDDLCSREVEELIALEASRSELAITNWTSEKEIQEGLSVIVVQAFAESSSDPSLTLVLMPTTCELLRAERNSG